MSSLISNSDETIIEIPEGNSLKIVNSSNITIATDADFPSSTDAQYECVIADTYEVGDPVYIGLDGSIIRPGVGTTVSTLSVPFLQSATDGSFNSNFASIDNTIMQFAQYKDTEYGVIIYNSGATEASIQKVRIYGKGMIPIGNPSIISTGTYRILDSNNSNNNKKIVYHEDQDRYIVVLVDGNGPATIIAINANGFDSTTPPSVEASADVETLGGYSTSIFYNTALAYVSGANPSIALSVNGGYYVSRITYTSGSGFSAGTVENVLSGNSSYPMDIEYNSEIDVLMLVRTNASDSNKVAIHFAAAAGNATDQYLFGSIIAVGTASFATQAIWAISLPGHPDYDFFLYDSAKGGFWKITYQDPNTATVASTFSVTGIAKNRCVFSPENDNTVFAINVPSTTHYWYFIDLNTNNTPTFSSHGSPPYQIPCFVTCIHGIPKAFGRAKTEATDIYAYTWQLRSTVRGSYPMARDTAARFFGVVAEKNGSIGGTAKINLIGSIHNQNDKLGTFVNGKTIGSQIFFSVNTTTGAIEYTTTYSSLYGKVGKYVGTRESSGSPYSILITPQFYSSNP